jgi:drug/metabolite transporter (DMT)-like permease
MLPYFTALITSFIFGLSFLFSKRAMMSASPFMLLSFRFLAAFIVMSVLIALKLIKVSYKNKPLKWLVILAIVEPVIYFIFETYGIKRTSSSVGGLMISLIPIAVTVLAAYFLKEIPTSKQITFIVTSVSGVILIVIMGGSDSQGTSVLGVLLLLGAVLSAAFFNIISRKISKYYSPMEITYFMMFVGAVSFNSISVVEHLIRGELTQYFAPLSNVTFISSILYLGILSSIVAYFLINYSLSKLEASKTSIFSNISTIVSIVAGVIFLKENFEIYHLVGSALILIGVWGTNYYNSKA